MKYNKYIICFAVLFLAFSSCRKDSDVTVWDKDSATDLDGFVTNTSGEGMAEVSITAGGKTTKTDTYGYFSINDANAVNDEVYIKANQSGFLAGSRRIYTKGVGSSHVRIALIELDNQFSFEAGSSGSVVLDDLARIDFDAQSIIDEQGNLYDGEVKVTVHYIDPTTLEGSNEMPGNLTGLDIAGNLVALGSYAMVGVELRGTNGQELNLKDGSTALLEFDIPPSLRANAPFTIPLWSFDEEEGVWNEDGTANRNGNKYVGAVSHFSFWNCDYPYPIARMKGQIQYRSKPQPAIIQFEVLSTGEKRIGYTNKEGYFSGAIPKGELLLFTIFDFCDNETYTDQLIADTEELDLGTINVSTFQDPEEIEISGFVTNCDGSPLANATLLIDGESTQKTNELGAFKITYSKCNIQAFTFKAIDLMSKYESETFKLLPDPIINVNLKICEKPLMLDQYVIMTMNNGEELINVGYLKETAGIPDTAGSIRFESSENWGALYHDSVERALNEEYNIKYMIISSEIESNTGQGRIEYRIINEEDPLNVIVFTKIASVDGEYTEGRFFLKNLSKYEVSDSGEIFLEDNIDITGTFRIKYED